MKLMSFPQEKKKKNKVGEKYHGDRRGITSSYSRSWTIGSDVIQEGLKLLNRNRGNHNSSCPIC